MRNFPMQPIVLTDSGVYRFQENRIVSAFLDAASAGKKLDLNDVARMDFTQAERMQFAQLIGYSVSGFEDLSYADRGVVRRAREKVTKMLKDRITES